MPALVCCLLHTYICATWILADICCLPAPLPPPPPADYYWQNGPCLLLAAYCHSSVCHLLMNAGWYLLSVIATCWLLLTEWHISTHVCSLLHAANLLPVTWCLMMSDICCLILPPASCLPTNWCPFRSVVCCTDTPVLLFVIWCSAAGLYLLSAIASSCLPTTYDCCPAFRLIPIVATGWYQLPPYTSYPFPHVDCCLQTYSF